MLLPFVIGLSRHHSHLAVFYHCVSFVGQLLAPWLASLAGCKLADRLLAHWLAGCLLVASLSG